LKKNYIVIFQGFFVLFILGQTAFGEKASRIELMDGTVYENATYKVDKQYKVITIQVGDWKRHVSFPDIARILDKNGNDVTDEYIGEYYQPSGQAPKGEEALIESKTPKRYRKRPFDVGFSFSPNYSFPLGDFYKGFTSGVGFGGDIIIPITDNVALRGTISKSGMTDDLLSEMTGFILLDDKLKLSVWRYLFSVEYYNWPRWKSDGKTVYYLYSGLGAITHTLSGTLWIKDAATGEIYALTGNDESQTKFVTTYGAGIVQMFSQKVGIELGGSFDLVYVGTYTADYFYYGNVQCALVFDLKVGIVALL
jgi:hypothetical protein